MPGITYHYTEANMENFLALLIPVALVLLFLKLCLSQIRLLWKIGINSLSGFICLWLLNLISGFTGFVFPINFVTALVVGFLGIPGILLLVAAQFLL